MSLSVLEVGKSYQIKTENRSKFQYTHNWKKDGSSNPEKDAVFKVEKIDNDGDYYGYLFLTDGKTPVCENNVTIVVSSEAEYFELFSSGAPAKRAKAAAKAGVDLTPLDEVEVMSSTEASHTLASVFATLINAAFQSDETKQLIHKAAVEVITQKVPRPVEVQFAGKKAVVENTHKELQTVLDRLKATKNIMLVGEAGCGKTFLAAQVAEALSLDFSSISCTSDMSSSALTGWLLPAEGGKFEYAESDFIRIYENGGVFLLDEMDAADPAILLIINQALANGRITVPQRKGNTTVKRHENFICFAACNTFGRGGNLSYSGRERLDESTLDRFRSGLVEMHYDNELEAKLIDPEVLAWGLAIRKKLEETKLKRIMSTRFLIDATNLKENAGYSMKDISDLYFVGWKQDEKNKTEI